MNPSALFTYARVSISRSASAHGRTGKEEMSVAFLERETFFVSAHSFHFPRLSPSAFLPFISRYFEPSSTSFLSSYKFAHSPLFLQTSCITHLFHFLHCLICMPQSLLSASRFPQFRHPFALAFQTSRGFTVLLILLPAAFVRFTISSRLKLRIRRNPYGER